MKPKMRSSLPAPASYPATHSKHHETHGLQVALYYLGSIWSDYGTWSFWEIEDTCETLRRYLGAVQVGLYYPGGSK